MSRLIFAFCYNAQDEGGRDFVLQTHIPKTPWPSSGQIIFYNASKALLGSSVDSEENNRLRGGAKLAPGPSVKARPWPKAET